MRPNNTRRNVQVRVALLAVLGALGLFGLAGYVIAGFETIDFPGSSSTNCLGVSFGGFLIQGYYNNGAGFQYENGGYSSIFISNFTAVSAVRQVPIGGYDTGDGSGCLNPVPGSTCFGFYIDEGNVVTVRFPGSTATMLWGENDGGAVVGTYATTDFVGGFIYGGGMFFGVPGKAHGINNALDVVGELDTDTGTHGYLFQDGILTQIDVPDAVSTIAWGIEDQIIVGEYTDGNGVTHGFRKIGDNFETIDFPDATSTTVHGVSGVAVVGSYTDVSGITHGFLFR